jgi:hypothetical protein
MGDFGVSSAFSKHVGFMVQYLLPLAAIHVAAFTLLWTKRRDRLVYFYLFVGVELIYGISGGTTIASPSRFNHYVHLADALLHGRLHLDFVPPYHDVSFFQGKYFISQPPLPSFIMMPFVALYGRNFNNVLFSILVGALNSVLLLDCLLRLQRDAEDSAGARRVSLVLSLFFAFGTVHWYVAVKGHVWHFAHIVALLCMLLSLRETFGKRRYFLMGLFASLAVMSRPSVLCIVPFFVVVGLRDFLVDRRIRRLAVNSVYFAVPYVLVGAAIMLWNAVRFGSPMDFGFAYMNHAPHLIENLARFGKLSFHYFPTNAFIAFLKPFSVVDRFPYLIPMPQGTAILLTSPMMIYAVRGLPIRTLCACSRRLDCSPVKDEYVSLGSLLAILCTGIPLLLYFNTGWVQFGYRYVLDYIPFVIILIALAMKGKVTKIAWGLLVSSVLINAYGVLLYVLFARKVFRLGVFL